MSEKVNITAKGIQKVLRNYNEKQAIAEYIWNGFDANADVIKIDYVTNELGRLDSLQIADNGYGINFNKLKHKFDPFFESEKAIQIVAPKHTSKMHGRNGVGRLTFFTFAYNATWNTTYQDEKGFHQGTIQINAGGLNHYEAVEVPNTTQITGTVVTFTNLHIGQLDLEQGVIPFLINEFCWFIELNRHKKMQVLINGNVLDFSSNIKSMEEFELVYPDTGFRFHIKYVHWKEGLHKELSKYYFLAGGEEIYKDYTTLNKKSDDYFHSVYINSDFFRDFDFKSFENEGQVALFGAAKSAPEYRFLIKELNDYLKNKRKPFLREYADRLINSFEQDGIFPKDITDREQMVIKPKLINLIKVLYEVEPKLFSSLSIDQKKMMIRLFDLALKTNEKEGIFNLLHAIVQLEEDDEKELLAVLELEI
ncbi:ATP-binding protein [Pedobacter sp. R20-19]|uniref:ATP-binding protein n=1 Tax=Pedobacter sp. R20-19 TaxID=1270196 RepID=UPI0004936222|nr:ATP-binding protein [Pedobacter sp. R20-19]